MFDSVSLAILLLVNVFFIGVLATVALRHAYLHFFPPKEVEKPRPTPPTIHIPTAMRDHLLEVSETKLQAILDRSANDLERDLKTITDRLDKQLLNVGSKIVEDEMQRYQSSLAELRAQADATLRTVQEQMNQTQAGLSASLSEHQTKLAAKLAEETIAEQQQLRERIDTKLGDAVAAFLSETLQHNVDLGAQSAYLTAMLEEHKAELAKGVIDDA